MKVGWKTVTSDETSPFNSLKGVETFEEGDKTSTIEIPISQEPRDINKDKFQVVLDQPQPQTSVVDENNQIQV